MKTVDEAFADTSEKLPYRGVSEIYGDICPHCRKKILERAEYTEDGGKTWRHIPPCNGLLSYAETPQEQISGWLGHYVGEAKKAREIASELLKPTEDLMPGVSDKDTTDGLKQLGTGGWAQGGPSSGDEDNKTRVDNVSENIAGLPPSGEEKYNKQEPGGTMAAVNTTSLSTEGTRGRSEREESKSVGPRDFERFSDNMMNFVNASNVPLKVTVTEITVMADEVHSVKGYIVRVDNG